MKLEELKVDEKFQSVYPYTPEQLGAMEAVAVDDGVVLQPLVCWDDVLIWGYPQFEILKKYPNLEHTIVEKSFEQWEDAKVWAVEHYISLPEINLAQKLFAAIQCEEYWKLKEAAKKAQGKRNDLSSQSEDKSDSTVVDALIGRKVGCSETYVYNFKRILGSGHQTIIDQCLKGNMTISAAYARLFLTNKKKSKGSKPASDTPIEIDMDSVDILEESEEDAGGNKKACRIPVDPKPIAEEIRDSDVSDSSLWIAIHLNEGQLQVVKKAHDKEKGCCHIKVNSFDCTLISKEDGRLLFKVAPINGGVEVFKTKDDLAYTKRAS